MFLKYFLEKISERLLVVISEGIIDLLLALLIRLAWQPLSGSPQGIIDGIPE